MNLFIIRRLVMKSKMSTQDFIQKAQIKHGDKYNYTKCIYDTSIKPVIIICNLCNEQFTQTPSNHLLGSGCKLCSIQNQRLSNKKFIEMSINVHGMKYDYTKTNYVNAKTKVDIFCNHCIYTFSQLPRAHIYEKQGCPKCKSSHGEASIIQILDRLGIVYELQKTFNGCNGLSNLPLRFDFYLPNFNILIEYDGKQHFDKTSRYWSESVITNDNIKNKFCFDNHIRLIRIDYKNYSNIEQILTTLLSGCCAAASN